MAEETGRPEDEHFHEPAEEHGPFPDDENFDRGPMTVGDFHNVVHKQVVNAVLDTMTASKMHWESVAPFLDAAREMCRSDFLSAGSVQVHGMAAEDETWKEAEEAYLEISIADQEDGHVWLSETFWLSDIVLTDPEPGHVRSSIRALERSVERLKAWLAEQDEQSPAGDPPPA